MTNEIYKPVFYWEGRKPLLRFIQRKIEKTVLANVNEFVHFVNPYMETWNKNYSGPEDEDFEDPKSNYMRYMYGKHALLMMTFKPKVDSIFIREWTVNDELTLSARTWNGGLCSIYWKPVDIEEVMKDIKETFKEL